MDHSPNKPTAAPRCGMSGCNPAPDGAGLGASDGSVKLRAFAMVTNGGMLPPGAPYNSACP
ncbi:hypothetical protein GCM10017687_26560 [Streptomyces echinatus]